MQIPARLRRLVAERARARYEYCGLAQVGEEATFHIDHVPDYLGYPTAGASDYAVLAKWWSVPEGLDLVEAATLPMAVETAVRSLDLLGLSAGQTIMINGGGTMTGFAAAQIALLRGAHVIASAGETFADRLRALGAKVTPYGDGMVERVREIAGGSTDFALHTAQVKGLRARPRMIAMCFLEISEAAVACDTREQADCWPAEADD